MMQTQKEICLDLIESYPGSASEAFKGVITCNETWRQSMQWIHKMSPVKKKPRLSKDKIMIKVFWDQDGLIFMGMLGKNTSINKERYCKSSEKLKRVISTQRPGQKDCQIKFHQDNARPHTEQQSEKVQRWRNKPDHSNETSKQSLPKIFTEETPPQRTSAYPLADRQRREQADRANDSPEIPARHGNRAAMWPKPCDKFYAFDLTSSRQCSRQQATINFTEATSVYKLYMERLQRQQEYKPRPSFLTELSHNCKF
ncbi:hypothetical protein LAZ67_11002380 [Cordylochernes scorpioides]|uniref:Transposase n=1 Tax=Cordylochernes scorpioides TaxID=51811 RepID=A0ABY6KZ95_9ARAC|nr:hypothetical protein LAZ67_11002380 [Cordylochernes scorpioides]